jgi:hypothetical protein
MNNKVRSYVSQNSNSLNAMIKKTSMTTKRQNINGKKLLLTITASTVLLGGLFAIGFGDEMIALAAKAPDVIDKSNGFPSGLHYNLHISGKGENFNPDPSKCSSDGGNTVFTPLYSTEGEGADQTLSMYVNKKASQTNLIVRDHCTEAFDGNGAQLQLPNKFEDGTPITDGMYVFARVLGGPDKGAEGDSNIVLIPNPDVEACKLTEEEGAGDASDCTDSNGNKQEFVELGYVTKNGAYVGDPEGDGEKLYRYTTDGEITKKGKGAKNGVNITGLFTWSGDACKDIVVDGEITIADFDIGNTNGVVDSLDDGIDQVLHIDLAETYAGAGSNSNGVVDNDAELNELIKILAEDESFEGCVDVPPTWVFNILGDDVDLVIYNQTLVNDGVSNLQIRFYPVETTLLTTQE